MGIIAALIAAVFLSSKDILSKKLSTLVDSRVSTFASFAFALPFYMLVLVVLAIQGALPTQFGAHFLILLALRSLTDCLAEWLRMHAFAHADISLVSCFFSLSPLFLLLLSPFVTGDQVTLKGGLAVSLIVAANALLLFRSLHVFNRRDIKGILLASAAALFFALNSCFDRLAVQEGSPLIAGFGMTLLSAILFMPILGRRGLGGSQLKLHWRAFTLRGLFETLFMLAKLWAMRFMHPAYVVAILRSSVLLSIISGKLLFAEEDIKRRLVAGVTIVIATLLLASELVN